MPIGNHKKLMKHIFSTVYTHCCISTSVWRIASIFDLKSILFRCVCVWSFDELIFLLYRLAIKWQHLSPSAFFSLFIQIRIPFKFEYHSNFLLVHAYYVTGKIANAAKNTYQIHLPPSTLSPFGFALHPLLRYFAVDTANRLLLIPFY